MAGPTPRWGFNAAVLLAAVTALAGCSVQSGERPDALLPRAAATSSAAPHQWQFEGTTMTPPSGWTLVKEIHEPVPTDGGPPLTSHTVGYAPRSGELAGPMIELNVLAGEAAPTTLAQVKKGEAAPQEWETSRSQTVILARDQARERGLTIAVWDETPTLHAAVIGRGGVTLQMVRDAVESVVIAP